MTYADDAAPPQGVTRPPAHQAWLGNLDAIALITAGAGDRTVLKREIGSSLRLGPDLRFCEGIIESSCPSVLPVPGAMVNQCEWLTVRVWHIGPLASIASGPFCFRGLVARQLVRPGT